MRKYFKNEKILESFSFHNYLADTYLLGLKDHVVLSELSTPVDFEKRLRSSEGAIYALRQDLPHSMMFRPSAKSRHIKGLYLVGASTHKISYPKIFYLIVRPRGLALAKAGDCLFFNALKFSFKNKIGAFVLETILL